MNKHTAEAVEEIIRANVAEAAGIEFNVVRAEDGFAEIRMPFDERMLRLGGTISGPTLMAAADTVMYALVIGADVNGQYGVTSHMNIEFLRRPQAAALLASGRILRRGRRQIVCAVEIRNEGDERLVAYATGAYALFDSATKSGSTAGSG